MNLITQDKHGICVWVSVRGSHVKGHNHHHWLFVHSEDECVLLLVPERRPRSASRVLLVLDGGHPGSGATWW